MINFNPQIQIIMLVGGILFLVLSIFFFILNIKKNKKLKKYSPIENIEVYKNNLEKECIKIEENKKELLIQLQEGKQKVEQLIEAHKNNLEKECIKIEENKKELLIQFKNGKQKVEQLKADIEALEETSNMQTIGFYRPIFEFNTSKRYKDKILNIKDKQKKLVKSKLAAVCKTEWTVEGSRQKGRTMTTQNLNFMIRAFNNECDVAISKVSWNNYDTIKNRIAKAFDMINKFNEPNHSYLTPQMLNLKLDELDATFKYKELLYQEREEQKAINAEIAEQKRAEAEIKSQQAKAEKEEQDALKKAKIAEEAYKKAMQDYEKKTDKEKEVMREQLKILKSQLDEAANTFKEKSGETFRIKSLAQQTKMGYVYILSNIGSFGPEVCKIGLTRRAIPQDRVTDLSGASVPFEFDCHAMIASEDAPTLENALHQAFADRRVNLANPRKEHFKVSLDEIELWLKNNGYNVELNKDREARTYYQTLAIMKSTTPPAPKPVITEDSFFNG